MQDCFIGEIRERKIIRKYIGKYLNIFEFFNIKLVFLSANSGSIKIIYISNRCISWNYNFDS